VGDIVRTIDVGYTAFGRLKRDDLIVNNIQAGDVIVGMASFGKASYEEDYNGGMGSNGLTSARHDVFEAAYRAKYPDSYDANTPKDLIYAGSKKLTDTIEINGEAIPIGKLVLSPTRTYLPVLKVLIDELKPKIHGLIHCTGGGQTKVGKFVENKRVVKNQLLSIPPLFEMIQKESQTGWKEMYQVFNMGHRMEVYLPEAEAERVIEIAKSFDIEAQVVGHVEQHTGNSVRIDSPYGQFDYDFD
ncbi:MAG: phosphoribosylformylglycinamidine cyclo-ligase, partial [Saprospiraceae bacterium]|nr:phosphoribosylformylglycinamidine cyclo-ligase [Saprospiraceae bacterium]